MGEPKKQSKLGQDLDRLYLLMRRAAVLGALLAIICGCLPERYRVPCHTVARICKGG